MRYHRIQILAAVIVAALGIGLMISLSLQSPGMPVQDEIAHFNLSRQAWQLPQLMLDVWGRPVNTIIYMLPALHSWAAARFTSIFLSAVSLLLTTLVGHKLGLRRVLFLVPVLLVFQPWFIRLGFTVLTEVPFTLFLIAGIYFWLERRLNLASLFFGSLLLIRHEGVILVAAWCIWLLIQREWKAFIIAAAPYSIYLVMYWLILKEPAFTIFLNARPTDLYGSGSWFHFMDPVFNAAGRLPIILSLFAIPGLWQRKNFGKVVLPFLIYFLTHTFIYRFGLFASGGYYLFLMPLATGIAITAAQGVENIFVWLNTAWKNLSGSRFSPILHFVAAAGIAVAMFTIGSGAQPYLLSEEESALEEVAEYLRVRGEVPQNVYSTHAYLNYLFDLPYSNWLYFPELAEFDARSIIVWDHHYSDRWGVEFANLAATDSPYLLVETFSDGIAAIFEKQSHSEQ